MILRNVVLPMDKPKYFLLVDPIRPSEKSSHNYDVQLFIEEYLDKQSLRYERGFSLKGNNLDCKIGSKSVTLLKLTVTALVNAFKAVKLARDYEVTIFNPNDDPFSLYTLQKIRKVTGSNFIIKSRFICTRDRILLEQNSLLVKHLQKKIAASIGEKDKISAETKIYSNFLSKAIRVEVDFVPYPPVNVRFNEAQIVRKSDLYVALGAARKDKGFETLPAWIDHISRHNPNAYFVVQKASKKWHGYDEALKALSRLENVKLLPSYIDARSQHELLTSAYAVLAPYDPVSYQFRGSAFTRRAMYLGKLVCATPETSMSKDAEEQNLLIFPESLNSELSNLEAHQVRQALGANLQIESIRAWRSFLL